MNSELNDNSEKNKFYLKKKNLKKFFNGYKSVTK